MEDVEMPKEMRWVILACILIVMAFGIGWWVGYQDSRPLTPEQVANNFEAMLFDMPYQHTFMQDTMTASDFKHFYLLYGDVSRGLLESVVSQVCYRDMTKDAGKWKLTVGQLNRDSAEQYQPRTKLDIDKAVEVWGELDEVS